MKAEKELEQLLHDHATYLRTGAHKVYRLDNGMLFTISLSPSDRNAVKVQLRQLQDMLGIKPVMVKRRPDNERKPGPPPRARARFDAPALPDWKDQLRRIRL